MAGLKDTLTRRVGPRLLIASAGVKPAPKLAAKLLRNRGGSDQVELFFAFDDPLSAVALLDLSQRLGAYQSDLVALPVVDRGMVGDPAVEWKRNYAILDATRLAARTGIKFARQEKIAPQSVRYLAEWVSAREPHPSVTAFCVDAVRAIWVDGVDPTDQAHFVRIWDERVGVAAPGPGTGRVVANEQRMAKRGPYDVPAAWVRGQWFFAHERGERLAETLNELGWGPNG